MAAITSAVIAIAGVILGWIAIEIACKPCLEKGREAIDRSLNPDYDPDDDVLSNNIRAPLHPNPDPVNPNNDDVESDPKSTSAASSSSPPSVIKVV
ncbi:outer envelope membrane protein 7 [Quillaja saponaria]|uniref:Outer envelope membrane protein 7 n=1 Tax=Quillaja saponaria TaxID=32244 RepID=A0AAD7PUS2_QUISA|nr:outer envelope membrane protein 7 [Quillaja saponaria]